ncbi:MAG: glycosyltransferase [Desulfobacterales bacterium]|jgi:UDP:flavonoid glycosyltransferase YjiC (YdhE family)
MSLLHKRSRRIALTTFGSLGDLNPFIALARGLQARGHQPIIATSAYYRNVVQAAGIPFHAIQPDLDPQDKSLLHRAMHPRRGTEVIIRKIVFPVICETYADLNNVLQNADTLVTHSMSYAGHIAAEKHGLPWISLVLSPIAFLSAYDMPVLPGVVVPSLPGKVGLFVNRLFIKIVKTGTRRWCLPVNRLRAELNLASGKHPLFEGQYSPELVLAMFSNVLARSHPDWPPQSRITGYGFYDEAGGHCDLPPQLRRFLNTGAPPIVFALGSAAVHTAGNFYRMAVETAVQLKKRAVLVVGQDTDNLPRSGLPQDVVSIDYAPYSKLFPEAAAIVHQGGIGTTGQALQAGKPTLVVPFAHDQPDNARRIERLGISQTLPFKRCSVRGMVRAIQVLMENQSFSARAAMIGQKVRAEDGVTDACIAIEELLSTKLK